MIGRLSAINLYPVKSAAGISVEQWPLDAFGLRLDRRWAVIDSAGVVLTQREYAGMAMVRAAIGETALRLEAPGMPLLEVPLAGSGGSRLPVRIWDDTCQAERCAPEVDEWWSALLGEWCHLVRLPDDSFRKEGPDRVSFADAFPFLILSEASLDALNARLEKPVPMNRFRPNLVVSSVAPHAEDEWSGVSVGSAELAITAWAPAASTARARSMLRIPPPTRHGRRRQIDAARAVLSPRPMAASRSMSCTRGKVENFSIQGSASPARIASCSP